jgi:hypothetical protein
MAKWGDTNPFLSRVGGSTSSFNGSIRGHGVFAACSAATDTQDYARRPNGLDQHISIATTSPYYNPVLCGQLRGNLYTADANISAATDYGKLPEVLQNLVTWTASTAGAPMPNTDRQVGGACNLIGVI